MISEDKLLKDLTVGEFKQYMEQLIEDILSKRMSYPQKNVLPTTIPGTISGLPNIWANGTTI